MSYDSVDTETVMLKIGWENTCSKCIFGTIETRLKSSKGRCTHKKPVTHYDTDKGWVCGSFVRRWDTKEDLELSKKEKQY